MLRLKIKNKFKKDAINIICVKVITKKYGTDRDLETEEEMSL